MLVHERTKSLLLKVADPFMIRDLLAKSAVLDHPLYNIQVKHTLESVKVLRNIGIDAPSPVLSQYNWPGKYKPFAHQLTMVDFLITHRRGFNLSEMGTGKTAACLWAADYLMKTGRVRKTLILSPLSTVDRVWRKDIFDVLMHRSASIVHGTREQREKAINADVDFYICNHDGVAIQWLADTIRRRPDIELVIVDEGSMFRTPNTGKYKALAKMLRPDQRLWWLTGTPCPNAPTDAWAQTKIVNPDRVPNFFGAFRRLTMMQLSQFKWAARPDGFKAAWEAMQPAVRFKKKDCLDLPPVTTTQRQATMTDEQRKLFNQMKNAMIAESKERSITAVNAADKVNKLRQILCGAVKDPVDGTYMTVPHGPRFDTLMECIQGASAKVIVVVPFKGIIQELAKEVSQHVSCAILNGDVSPKTRDKIIRAFKEEEHPHTLLCHPKVMAHGLNLTEADTLIFYAPIYSNDEYQQVLERFNRAGQTRKMTVVKMACHPLEWEIYRMLDGKQLTQESILNLYKSVTN